MAAGISSVITCAIIAFLIPIASGDRYCKAYYDTDSTYHHEDECDVFCCGSCINRYCCRDSFWRLTEDRQEQCYDGYGPNYVSIGSSVVGAIIFIVIIISCCVCPCCCLYNVCRKPRPVIATTTHHTTVVTHAPQQYPQQPTAGGGPMPSHQGGQYPGYQAVPAQPSYGPQPMPQPYGAQPMLQGYGAQPMPQAYGGQPMPAAPYPAQTPGPPPPYHEAMGPGFGPPSMAYSQAAFSPGQPSYPLQPPAQANAPTAPADHGQPAYNPAYAQPPPKTGY